MTTGIVTQVRQRRAQLRRRPTDPDIFPVGSMAFEQFKRHEELTAGGMEGKCLEQPRDGLGAPGVMAERVDVGSAVAVQNLRGKGNEAGGCTVRIYLKVGERRHRLVVEIESARRDRRLQTFRRQS